MARKMYGGSSEQNEPIREKKPKRTQSNRIKKGKLYQILGIASIICIVTGSGFLAYKLMPKHSQKPVGDTVSYSFQEIPDYVYENAIAATTEQLSITLQDRSSVRDLVKRMCQIHKDWNIDFDKDAKNYSLSIKGKYKTSYLIVPSDKKTDTKLICVFDIPVSLKTLDGSSESKGNLYKAYKYSFKDTKNLKSDDYYRNVEINQTVNEKDYNEFYDMLMFTYGSDYTIYEFGEKGERK